MRVKAEHCKNARFTFLLKTKHGNEVLRVFWRAGHFDKCRQKWSVHIETDGYGTYEYGFVMSQPNKSNSIKILNSAIDEGVIPEHIIN